MRKLIMVMVFCLSILFVGCNEIIVLEEDTVINDEMKEFEVIEKPIDLDEDFWVLRPRDGKFRVVRSKYGFDNGKNEYISGLIDGEGNIKDNKENDLVASEYGSRIIYSLEGITQEYDTQKEGSLREFYYRDSLKDITIRLDGFYELTKKYRTSNGYIFEPRYIENNENYYMLLISKYDSNKETGLVHINTDEQMMIIIDIENEKMYHRKVDTFEESDENNDNTIISNHSKSKDNCVYSLYYDEEIESIMAITFGNKVKKVNLKSDDIELEEHITLNLQGYELDDNGLDFGRAISSENFVIRLNEPKDDSKIFAIYNSKSGEINLLEEEMYVTSELGEYNLVTIAYKNEAYLVQIKDDYTVEILYKFTDFTDEGYKCITAYSVMSEEDDRIFTVKTMYGGDSLENGFDNTKVRTDYSFIDLKGK